MSSYLLSMDTTKLAKLKAKYAAGDKIGALAIAAKFPRLGEHTEAIQKAWAAHQNPGFYVSIKEDPKNLVEAGIKALEERYGL